MYLLSILSVTTCSRQSSLPHPAVSKVAMRNSASRRPRYNRPLTVVSKPYRPRIRLVVMIGTVFRNDLDILPARFVVYYE